MRYSVFDGLRGVFLLLMMYGHTTTVLQSRLGKAINHHQLGFADAANGFVFLSGLVIALYFMRVLRERGDDALGPLVRRRVLFIYKYHIGALLGLALLANLFPLSAGRLELLRQMGADEYLAAVFLIHQPSFFDILPMYMVFIAATPLVLRTLNKGHTWSVLACSVCLWLLAQTGFITAFINAVEWKIAATSLDIRIGLFSLFAWQLLYVAGLMSGYFIFTGRLDIIFMRTLPASFLKIMVAAFFGIFLLQYFMLHHPSVFDGAVEKLAAVHSKWNFSIFYVVSVIVYGVLIVWLYVAGPHSTHGIVASVARGFRAFLISRPLVLLGRNSIQVFTFHLVVVYLLSPLPDLYPMREMTRFAVLIVSTLSLFAFVAIWTWVKKFRQRRQYAKASV